MGIELFTLFGSILLKGSDETSKALDDIDEKGKKADNQLSNMAKTADKMGKAIMAATAAAVTGLVKMTFDTAAAADEINTLSKVTGLSTRTIQEMNFAAETLDVSTETMTGSMTRMIRTMSEAQKGSGDAADAFRKLRVNIYDSRGQLKDSEEVFYSVIDALSKVQNETERDALAMEIFGRSARDLNPLIIAGSKSLKEMGQQAEKMGYIMDQSTLDSLNKLQDSIDMFKNQAATFKQSIAIAMLPVLEGLFDILNKIDPKVVAVVAIIATVAGVAISVAAAIKKVTDVFKAFDVGAMKTTLIVIGIVAALIALAAIIAVIIGKSGELNSTMAAVGQSVNQVQSSVNQTQSSYRQQQQKYVGSYEVGTNRVPEDGFAFVHKDEAIVPKKYNPAVGGIGAGGDTYILQVNMDEIDDVIKLKNVFNGLKQAKRSGAGRARG